MARLRVSLFIGALFLSGPVAPANDVKSAMAECSELHDFTFENWREWPTVTPDPVVSIGHSGNWVRIYLGNLCKSHVNEIK